MNYKILLNRLLQKRYKKIAAVDIGARDIKIAVLNCGKRVPVVVKLVLEELPAELQDNAFDFGGAGLADFISSVFKREKLTADVVVFAAGADKTALFNLQLPNMADNELQEAVRWELAQELNSEPDSFCSAAAYLTAENTGLNKVVAAVMPQHIANVFISLADKFDLPLGGIFMRPLSIEQTLAKGYENFCLLEAGQEGEAVLTTFCHGLPVLQKTFDTSASAEIETALALAKSELLAVMPEAEIKQLVVNGNAADNIEVAGVNVVKNNIAHSIGFAENLETEYLKQLDMFAAAIGAAMCFVNKSGLNLMPLKQSTLSFSRWQFYRAAAVCCVACFLAAWVWQLVQLYTAQNDLQKVRQEIAAMGKWQERYEAAAAANQQISRRLKLTETLRSKNTNWQQVLTEIADSTPPGCWLEKIEQGQEKEIIISGYAATMDKAVDFAEALAGQKSNAKAELAELKTAQFDGRTAAAFNLLIERK